MRKIRGGRRTVLVWILVAVPAAGRPAESGKDDFTTQRALFSYDVKRELSVQQLAVEKREQTSIYDITFSAAAEGPPVKAYLVVPDGRGPFAATLWVHWLGAPATTNRTQHLGEAIALAPRGLISLLVDAMWAAPHWYTSRDPERDYESSIRQVVALRRALDLLDSQPTVDRSRIGFVGHDYGAMYGMLMSGVDGRPKTCVYVAPASSFSDWAFFARQPQSKADYLRQNATLEPTDYLRQVKNASTLFQFGARDPFVSESGTSVLLNAAQAPKERRFYEGDHTVDAPEAARDRAEWLTRELGLIRPSLPPAPGP